MTLDDIRKNHSTMTDAQLEEEIRFRDRSVVAIRTEMREIRLILDPRNVKKQRAVLANSKGPKLVLGVGVKLNG